MLFKTNKKKKQENQENVTNSQEKGLSCQTKDDVYAELLNKIGKAVTIPMTHEVKENKHFSREIESKKENQTGSLELKI